jgi:RNA polymerase sigma factor (TIGR02999 family)
MLDSLQGTAMPIPQPDVSELLRAWSSGDKTALDLLAPLVYGELRRIASRYMRDEQSAITLQTTEVVHEAFLRLVDARNVHWSHRAQFFAIAAQMMRRILVDAARARGSLKRGGNVDRINLDQASAGVHPLDDSIIAVDIALSDFAKIAPRQATVVEMRFFVGLNVEEIAKIMAVSTRSIERDWQFARSWLMRELVRLV